MIIKSYITEAVKSLFGAKQRTILALIGIIIGIGSVIAMVSIGIIVEKESLRQFKKMGSDILTIRKGIGNGGISSDKKVIRFEDVMNIPSRCRSLTEVAPYITGSQRITYAGKGEGGGLCFGVTESFKSLNKIRIKEGRFISDLDRLSYFCVLGERKARWLNKIGLHKPAGNKIIVGERLFLIIGVLENVPFGGMGPSGINDGVLIPIKTAERITEGALIDTIIARMSPQTDHIAAKEEVSSYFQSVKGPTVAIFSAEELIEQMSKQMRLFTLLLGAVGSISLIVGGVGVMNVMLVSVTERRREIGIRRSLGAKRKDIQGQFLIEAILLSLIGGAIGIGLGILASYIISYFSGWQFFISSIAILLGVGVSTAVGIFFGFYPARQASRLDPITALRSE